jgi:hypothetical protein
MRKILIICLLFSALQAVSQTEDGPYAKQWKLADSLIVKSLPGSAKEIVLRIYDDAKNNNRQSEQLKAQIYLLHITKQNTEDADAVSIAQAEKEAMNAKFPYDAVWYSIIAEMYWNYYNINRWKILRRTAVEHSEGKDPGFWDANKFYNKVSALYQKSIARYGELQKIPITELNPVLTEGVNTAQLRPTVYDLLAFRAVGYFENDEHEVTKPSYRFTISGADYFADAASFVKLKLSSKDTGSLHFKALKLYQQIIAFHIKDDKPDALIDADIQRLSFVYNNATAQNKKHLYGLALKRITISYPHNMQASVAHYLLLELNDNYDYYGQEGDTTEKTDLPALKKGLEQIVKDYPKSEGASMAQGKLLEITQKTINANAEAVVLPGEHSKFLLNYRNISKVYLRIVTADPPMLTDRYSGQNVNTALLERTPINNWQETLPGTEDFRPHSAEIKIAPLEPGAYAVLVSTDTGFRKDSTQIISAIFQVSSLSLVQKERKEDQVYAYVLNRKTGRPVEGADVKVYNTYYTGNDGYKTELINQSFSDKNGAVISPNKKSDGSQLEIKKVRIGL